MNVENIPSVVLHACNLSTEGPEAGGIRVKHQPGVHSKFLSKKTKTGKGENAIKNQNATPLLSSFVHLQNPFVLLGFINPLFKVRAPSCLLSVEPGLPLSVFLTTIL